ncbi:alcohol dehydrogenase catalytic domain-containing protein [Sphingobium sp.]|uniref:alcohol dehydrogenase catalytic domain-containing protein n=1 Tax=Sphingobium sp. TaxID=1912891 RepID=UPI0028BE7709|nr:alcohol dehydrogenase catalytic domain-containing protein [Sphingobium sp.]
MNLPDMMTVARMHAPGDDLVIEEIPVPVPGPLDVLVKVKACGIVPNLGNVLRHVMELLPNLPRPPLPAIFGLDPVGEIAQVGSQVHNLSVGQRVYANPGRSCGSCARCRRGDTISCQDYALQGYLGCRPEAVQTLRDYPYGGLGQYMIAPATAMVGIPDNVTFDQAARFGYLGTMFAALRKLKAGPGDTILINGISGTLGIGGALLGLAMGVDRILGTGRDPVLLERVKALAPDRIETFSILDGSVRDWVMERTNGAGVDGFVDALGPGAAHETFNQAFHSLRRGGSAVNIGAIVGGVPIDLHWMMDNGMSLYGSGWFTTDEAEMMAGLARNGLLDMSVFKTHAYALKDVNEAISGIAVREGGFSNFVIRPHEG